MSTEDVPDFLGGRAIRQLREGARWWLHEEVPTGELLEAKNDEPACEQIRRREISLLGITHGKRQLQVVTSNSSVLANNNEHDLEDEILVEAAGSGKQKFKIRVFEAPDEPDPPEDDPYGEIPRPQDEARGIFRTEDGKIQAVRGMKSELAMRLGEKTNTQEKIMCALAGKYFDNLDKPELSSAKRFTYEMMQDIGRFEFHPAEYQPDPR
jgi:hypothetical protein